MEESAGAATGETPDNKPIVICAAYRDGKKYCELTVDSPNTSTWSDVERQLIARLDIDESNTLFTYSINKDFFARPHAYAFRCMGLVVESDWKAALMTAGSVPDRMLYIIAEEIESRPDFLLSVRSMSAGITELSDRPAKESKRDSRSTWDFLESESDSVRQLWKSLPSLTFIPFSSLLIWHKSSSQHGKSAGLVRNALHAMEGNVGLQEFEWRSFMDKNRRLVNEPELRLRVFYGGVSAQLRPIVWRHLLYVFPPKLKWNDRYVFMDVQRQEYIKLRDAWQSSVDSLPADKHSLITTIRHDVIRTDRERNFFAESLNPHLECLYNILVTFALDNPDISYVQGMNEMAAVFLEVYDGSEADAYICLKSYLRLVPAMFDPKGLALKFSHFQALLQRYDATLFDHLKDNDCSHLVFCYAWLLLNMKREFAREDVLLLWDVIWSTLSPPDWYLAELDTIARTQQDQTSPDETDAANLEYGAREVEGTWLRASMIEVGELAEASTPLEDDHRSLGDTSTAKSSQFPRDSKVSLQRQYGNVLILFLSVALITSHRLHFLSIAPSEEGLSLFFSKLKGLHNVHALLNRARTMMEDFVSTNDEAPRTF